MQEEVFHPDVFDSPERMARLNIDMDICDSGRALLGDNVDLDDRAAVERAVIAPDAYRHIPETFRRFVDRCINAARDQREYAQSTRH
jgi:hypothetical protein